MNNCTKALVKLQNQLIKKYVISFFLMSIFTSTNAVETIQNKDVTYYAIVKNHVFAQDWHGNVTETGYSFLGYIFLKQDSEITNAYLSFPGASSRREVFPDFRKLNGVEKDTYLFIRSEKIYTDKDEYDKDYADGKYLVEFTSSAGSHRAELSIEGGVYPEPAVMTLSQSGKKIQPDAIDATQDLGVSWGGFPQGRADPRGILDDVVFVIVKDCHGGKLLHSGRPYQGFHLLYSNKNYVIPRHTMLAGRKYELIVDNGMVVDSNTDAGVPGVGFYAQTNKMPIYTTGASSPDSDCAIK